MTALENFEAGVAEVALLLDVAEVDPPEGTPKDDRANAVHRACVVLLVSHFESFLKTLAEEFTDVVGGGHLESRQIPRGVRELHTLPRLKEVLECGDDTQRGVLLKKLQPLMVLWNDSAKPPPGTLKASTLSRQVTNAYSETIDDLFSLMGNGDNVCDGDLDVADENGDVTPINIRYGLTDVVKCRNDIAHGDATRRPTGADVQRYVRFLATMAQRLTRKAGALLGLVSP